MFIVCLSGRAGKLKRKDKSCLLFVYQAGPGSLKESPKVVNCLFIRQGQEVLKRQQSCLMFVYQARLGSLKKRQKVVYLSDRARKLKRKAKSGLLFVYQTGPES